MKKSDGLLYVGGHKGYQVDYLTTLRGLAELARIPELGGAARGKLQSGGCTNEWRVVVR